MSEEWEISIQDWNDLETHEQLHYVRLMERSDYELRRLLRLVQCPEHGDCIPYLTDWIKSRQQRADELRSAPGGEIDPDDGGKSTERILDEAGAERKILREYEQLPKPKLPWDEWLLYRLRDSRLEFDALVASADDLIDEEDSQINNLKARIGLAIIHISDKAQCFSERNQTAVLQQLHYIAPDAIEKYDQWLTRQRQDMAHDDDIPDSFFKPKHS